MLVVLYFLLTSSIPLYENVYSFVDDLIYFLLTNSIPLHENV